MTRLESYSQPVKKQVRRLVLGQAVKTLTSDRSRAAVVIPREFLETLNYAVGFLATYYRLESSFRSKLGSITNEWLKFQQTVIGRKRPSDLRVLYLCGPEPNNDLEVFLELGVLSQNIWAVESGDLSYAAAVEQLRTTANFIRIHHGSLGAFFSTTNERFDIIYIDACGTFPEPRELQSILEMFRRERLASPGILITNYSQPAQEKREIFERLMAAYFAPRMDDTPRALLNSGYDNTVGDIDLLKQAIRGNFGETFSDFVTRYIVELGREIIPHERIVTNRDIKKKYFADKELVEKVQRRALAEMPAPEEFEDADTWIKRFYKELGDVYLSFRSYPVLNFLLDLQHNGDLQCFSAGIDVEAYRKVSLLAQVLQGHWEIASDQMLGAIRSSWFDGQGGVFCDVPLPHLLINSALGIYGRPYFPNPRRSARYSYVAKKATMYTDLLLFDQCRYYFDFLPTLDLLPKRFESIGYQLVLRACLDRIERHDFSSSSNPFRGCALGGFGTTRCAKAFDFAERKNLG